MGQASSLHQGPHTVVIYQSGGGQNCDCGAARFSAESVIQDVRLAQAGLGTQEVRDKFSALNTQMKKRLTNPCKLLIPMFVCIFMFCECSVPRIPPTAALFTSAFALRRIEQFASDIVNFFL